MTPCTRKLARESHHKPPSEADVKSKPTAGTPFDGVCALDMLLRRRGDYASGFRAGWAGETTDGRKPRWIIVEATGTASDREVASFDTLEEAIESLLGDATP